MESTKEELVEAILFFAEKYGLRRNYEFLIMSKITLPELVKMITYEMFLNRFTPPQLVEKDHEKYGLILNYAKELNEKGWVDFK